MNYYCYILQSEKTRRLYIGQTYNLEDRIYRHNSNQNKSTKNKGPWKILHAFEFDTRAEAVRMENKLKKWKSPKRILALIEKSKLSDN